MLRGRVRQSKGDAVKGTNTTRTFESKAAQCAFDLLSRNAAVFDKLVLGEMFHHFGNAHGPLISKVVVKSRVARVGTILEKRAS